MTEVEKAIREVISLMQRERQPLTVGQIMRRINLHEIQIGRAIDTLKRQGKLVELQGQFPRRLTIGGKGR